MKKIILTLVVLANLMMVAKAQGNLQFNQVIYRELSITITANITNPFTQITLTVPAGKVWKIESVITSQITGAAGSYGYYTDGIITLNGRVLHFGGWDSPSPLPVWLPEGSYTLVLSRNCAPCYSSSSPPTINGSISAIEFNIVP